MALTLLWDAYLVLFATGMVVAVALFVARGEPVFPTPAQIVAVLAVQVLMVLLGIGLVVAYVVDVHRNPAFDGASDQRVVWTLLVVFAGPVAMPWYWLRHVRRRSRQAPRLAVQDTSGHRGGGVNAGQ